PCARRPGRLDLRMADETASAFQLRPDSPAESDAFGAHQAIASAIAKLIELNPGRGYGIALVGERGCGKSTVISLLKKKLGQQTEASRQVCVFTFDAWAHEGDRLRRAFLEELLTRFTKLKWVADGWLQRWPKRFRGKLSEKRSVSSGGLTIAALLFAAWIVLRGSYHRDELAGMLPLWAGWTLVAAAAALFLAQWILAWIPEIAFARTAHHTVATPAASSIEFRSKFVELARKAGLDSRERTLVIVLEDLDRVSPREQRQALAVMRTFFDCNDHEALRRVWTLIPLRVEMRESDARRTNQEELEGQIEKLCQLRFVVPPPLVSDWRRFLKNQICEQLAWADNDADLAVAIYAERLGGLPQTPRRLGSFVNELAAVSALREFSPPPSLTTNGAGAGQREARGAAAQEEAVPQAKTEAVIRLAANVLSSGSQ